LAFPAKNSWARIMRVGNILATTCGRRRLSGSHTGRRSGSQPKSKSGCLRRNWSGRKRGNSTGNQPRNKSGTTNWNGRKHGSKSGCPAGRRSGCLAGRKSGSPLWYLNGFPPQIIITIITITTLAGIGIAKTTVPPKKRTKLCGNAKIPMRQRQSQHNWSQWQTQISKPRRWRRPNHLSLSLPHRSLLSFRAPRSVKPLYIIICHPPGSKLHVNSCNIQSLARKVFRCVGVKRRFKLSLDLKSV